MNRINIVCEPFRNPRVLDSVNTGHEGKQLLP
jgi:hypothetical protein